MVNEIMKLSDCSDGDSLIIKNINLDKLTERRLKLLGFTLGSPIELVKKSVGTSLVLAGGRLIALGRYICDMVEVDNASSSCR